MFLVSLLTLGFLVIDLSAKGSKSNPPETPKVGSTTRACTQAWSYVLDDEGHFTNDNPIWCKSFVSHFQFSHPVLNLNLHVKMLIGLTT